MAKQNLKQQKEEVKVEVGTIQEPTIFDKYRIQLNQVKEGYLRLDYDQSIEILRWMEKETGRNLPINYSCSTCMLDFMKQFARMEK